MFSELINSTQPSVQNWRFPTVNVKVFSGLNSVSIQTGFKKKDKLYLFGFSW